MIKVIKNIVSVLAPIALYGIGAAVGYAAFGDCYYEAAEAYTEVIEK